MQSPIFAYTEAPSPDHYTLQNSYMLRVRLDGNTGPDCLARKGSMVAYEGMIEFDGEWQPHHQRRARRATGEGLDLMRCSGQGTVYLANLAQQIHILDVDHDGLTVDSAYVLAMDSGLHWEVIAVDTQFGLSGTGKYNLVISGHGKVALMTSGKPLMMPVTPNTYVSCDSDAVVAWSTPLRVQMQAQTSSSSVFRRRGNTGEGWELNFVGQGYALVQPSEQLPPQNTDLHGLHGQLGVGGRPSGNPWGG